MRQVSITKSILGRTKIIGLDDDEDSEPEDSRPWPAGPKKGKRAKDEEKELRNDIIELEKTFDNLELDNNIVSTSTTLKKNNRSLYRASTFDESHTFSQAVRPNRGLTRPPVAFGTPLNSKPLKFSWEESKTAPVVDKDNEDWNYKQVS